MDLTMYKAKQTIVDLVPYLIHLLISLRNPRPYKKKTRLVINYGIRWCLTLLLDADLEPLRDQEGFYSVEVIKATVNEHGFELNKIDERTLLGQHPNSIGRYVISNLQERIGMVSLIIRQRNHQHWLTITVQDSMPIIRDSQTPFPRVITRDELGNFIDST